MSTTPPTIGSTSTSKRGGRAECVIVNRRELCKLIVFYSAPSQQDKTTKVEMSHLRLCCPLIWLLLTLLSSSVASSFIPRSSRAPLPRDQQFFSKLALSVKGGSDEEAQISESNFPPPPPQMEATDAPAEVAVPSPAEVAVPTPSANAGATLLGPNAPPPGFLRRTLPSFPWHRLPNFLTYVRCLAIPALMGVFYLPDSHILAGSLFAVASYTEWVDGYLARRWDITSAFGAFLDPVADKLMVSTSLILLAGRYGSKIAIPSAIILAREIAVSALREWMAQRGERNAVKVGFQGKVKTALTMFALTILLFVPTEGTGILSKLYTPGLAMLYLSALVTVTSGSVYFIAAAPLLFK
jgi:CDP-diacylglycerol--glycerol-3-phosphate 3-phosphatidyltransferase